MCQLLMSSYLTNDISSKMDFLRLIEFMASFKWRTTWTQVFIIFDYENETFYIEENGNNKFSVILKLNSSLDLLKNGHLIFHQCFKNYALPKRNQFGDVCIETYLDG